MEGRDLVAVLYSYRSCVKALPQVWLQRFLIVITVLHYCADKFLLKEAGKYKVLRV